MEDRMSITVRQQAAPRTVEYEVEIEDGQLLGFAKYEEGREMAFVRFGCDAAEFTRQECLVAAEFFAKVADVMLPSPSSKPKKAPRTGSRKARVTP
jgi:hypothetical protein